MKELDIASFAENLIEETTAKGKPVQFAAAQAPDAPDVSEVEVSNDFTAQVLTEGHWDKADIKVKPSSPTIKRKYSSELSEEVQIRKDLFEEYRRKLGELDQIIQEITTVGMGGMGGMGAEGGKMPSSFSVAKKRLKKKKRNANR